MITQGLLLRIEVKPGKEIEAEDFLRSALSTVLDEPGTAAWYALRFGRLEYGIFDAFPDEAARQAHLKGPVARAIVERVGFLFVQAPSIRKVSVLATKLPASLPVETVTKGLLLSFKAKSGHEAQLEQFLLDARPMVLDEPKTTAWFALRFDSGEYGIFDVFPDNGGRFSHLTGQVPRELAKHALSLLGGFPDLDLLGVLESFHGDQS